MDSLCYYQLKIKAHEAQDHNTKRKQVDRLTQRMVFGVIIENMKNAAGCLTH